MLRLGLSSFAYRWAAQAGSPPGASLADPAALVARVAALGLEALQICENLPLHGLDRSRLDQLKRAARQAGVALTLGARGFTVEHFGRYLDIADRLGARVLRVLPEPGTVAPHLLPADSLRQLVDTLLPAARAQGTILALENHFFLPDKDLAELVRAVNDPYLGICLDTANSIGLITQPLQTVEMLAPYAVLMHLKDFSITKEIWGYKVFGVPLGRGGLDAQAALDMAAQMGREPDILLELWTEPAEHHDATLQKEDEGVRASVDYARDQLGLGVN